MPNVAFSRALGRVGCKAVLCGHALDSSRRILSFGWLKSESIGKSSEIVIEPDDMRDFQTCTIVETEITQRFPIFLRHARWSRAELFREFAQGPLARRQAFELTPPILLYGIC